MAGSVLHTLYSSTKYLRLHLTTNYKAMIKTIANIDARNCYVKQSMRVALTLDKITAKTDDTPEVRHLHLVFKPPYKAVIVFEAPKLKWNTILSPYLIQRPLYVLHGSMEPDIIEFPRTYNIIIKEPNFEHLSCSKS